MIHINDIFLMVIVHAFKRHEPQSCGEKLDPADLPSLTMTLLYVSYVIFYTQNLGVENIAFSACPKPS